MGLDECWVAFCLAQEIAKIAEWLTAVWKGPVYDALAGVYFCSGCARPWPGAADVTSEMTSFTSRWRMRVIRAQDTQQRERGCCVCGGLVTMLARACACLALVCGSLSFCPVSCKMIGFNKAAVTKTRNINNNTNMHTAIILGFARTTIFLCERLAPPCAYLPPVFAFVRVLSLYLSVCILLYLVNITVSFPAPSIVAVHKSRACTRALEKDGRGQYETR